jgi:hypothetical protein
VIGCKVRVIWKAYFCIFISAAGKISVSRRSRSSGGYTSFCRFEIPPRVRWILSHGNLIIVGPRSIVGLLRASDLITAEGEQSNLNPFNSKSMKPALFKVLRRGTVWEQS